MTRNRDLIKKLVSISAIAAIMVVLQLTSTYLPKLPGGLSINLTLIPIVIGSILYGPLAGLFLGIINAIVVMFDPTISVFYAVGVFQTVLVILLKTSLAGLCSGLIFKLFNKINFHLAVVIAAIICPTVNTLVFTVGCTIFFQEVYGGGFIVIFVGVAFNYLVELGINLILSSAICTIVKAIARRHREVNVKTE